MRLGLKNFLGGFTFQVFAPKGSYYRFSIYSTYAHEMHIIRTHLFHWSRWWCQKWNWTPLSHENECFNLGSNFNMRSYDSYLCNIPTNRTHFLYWVRWWYFRCNLTPWWRRITCLKTNLRVFVLFISYYGSFCNFLFFVTKFVSKFWSWFMHFKSPKIGMS